MDYLSKLNLNDMSKHFKIVKFTGKTVSTLKTVQTVLTLLTIGLTVYRIIKMMTS